MDWQMLFFLLVAFLLGRASKLKYYIGYDESKYKAADVAILLRTEHRVERTV
jgi:hypothetical protein